MLWNEFNTLFNPAKDILITDLSEENFYFCISVLFFIITINIKNVFKQ